MHAYKNVGFGGTKVKADGNKYCNMVGHADGREDYVWTLSTGRMRIYPNKGLQSITSGQSFWGPNEIIWDPMALIGKNLDRRDLHLMDWDGDGTCDIVWVNPDDGNRQSVWLNHFPTTQKWSDSGTWQYYADPPSARSANVHCDQQRGIHIDDLSVRFGDIDGNKRDDFLCLEKNGRVTGYVHNDDNSWTYVGQVKVSEGKDRANLRWADVNGDGADDMIWVDKFSGDGRAYYNRGFGDASKLGGSAVSWDKSGSLSYMGAHAGTCQFFPDLDGNGRADLHSVLGPFSNTADTWFNPSCSLVDRQGDDPGCCSDPGLPVQPGSGGDNP